MKRYLHLSLVVLFPYSILFAIVCMFRGYFTEFLFWDYGAHLLGTLLVFYLVALICSIATLIVSIKRQWSGKEILRINMTIKLLHILPHVSIFIVGLLFLFMLFSSLMYENYRFILTIILMSLNCMTICLTGLIGLSGIARGFAENVFSKKEAIIYGLLQFVFFVDTVSSIIAYKKAKLYTECIHEQRGTTP